MNKFLKKYFTIAKCSEAILIKKKQIKKNFLISFIEKDHFFSISDSRHSMNIKILRFSQDELVSEINGIDFSFNNSLRRILLSEAETITIDRVFFYDNSSVFNDEMIAHRLGLIPVFVNSNFLKYISEKKNKNSHKIFFELKISQPSQFLKKISVFSDSLKWKPYGLSASLLKNSRIKPVFRDILILKLNPGQRINCECHCSIGKGNFHAKFSPVATAFYRIFPQVKIIREIMNKNAKKIYKKCPVRVFEIRKKNDFDSLIISSTKHCTLCRECTDPFDSDLYPIKIGRVKDKVTFIIESTGVMSPEKLFSRAIFLLIGKCNKSLNILLKNFNKRLV